MSIEVIETYNFNFTLNGKAVANLEVRGSEIRGRAIDEDGSVSAWTEWHDMSTGKAADFSIGDIVATGVAKWFTGHPTGTWTCIQDHIIPKQKKAAKQKRDLDTPEGKIVDAIQGLTITLEKALQEFLGRAEPVIHKYKNLQVETINGSPVRWRQSNGSVWSQWKVVTIQDLESSSYWQAYAGEKESE